MRLGIRRGLSWVIARWFLLALIMCALFLTSLATVLALRTQTPFDPFMTVFLRQGTEIFVLVGLGWLIFQVLVAKHLNVMAAYCRKLSIDNLENPLFIKRSRLTGSDRDELHGVVRAINEMRLSLRDALEEGRHTDEALVSQRDLFNNILSTIPSSIYWKNSELVYVGCNENFCHDAGLNAIDDVLGKTDDMMPWMPLEKVFFKKRDAYILSTGRSIFNQEENIHFADGLAYTVLSSTVPLKDDKNCIIGLLGIYTDITDRKIVEEKSRKLNDTLEQSVILRTEELQQRHRELTDALHQLRVAQELLIASEKMASLGGLVAGVAHEINTPIGIGVTAASHLRELVVKIDNLSASGEMKRFDFEQFLQSSNELTNILLKNLQRSANLIMSFKNVAVDQSTDNIRQFHIKATIEEILFSLKPKLKKTPISINVDCDEDFVIISNPGAISHIITNLVMNSLLHGYGPNDTGRICLRIEKTGNTITIIYSDNGKGIPADLMRSIFDPFFTTKRGEGGSGLGLHILYNAVTQLLQGTVKCESEPGVHTTFTLRFPCQLVVE